MIFVLDTDQGQRTIFYFFWMWVVLLAINSIEEVIILCMRIWILKGPRGCIGRQFSTQCIGYSNFNVLQLDSNRRRTQFILSSHYTYQVIFSTQKSIKRKNKSNGNAIYLQSHSIQNVFVHIQKQ